MTNHSISIPMYNNPLLVRDSQVISNIPSSYPYHVHLESKHYCTCNYRWLLYGLMFLLIVLNPIYTIWSTHKLKEELMENQKTYYEGVLRSMGNSPSSQQRQSSNLQEFSNKINLNRVENAFSDLYVQAPLVNLEESNTLTNNVENDYLSDNHKFQSSDEHLILIKQLENRVKYLEKLIASTSSQTRMNHHHDIDKSKLISLESSSETTPGGLVEQMNEAGSGESTAVLFSPPSATRPQVQPLPAAAGDSSDGNNGAASHVAKPAAHVTCDDSQSHHTDGQVVTLGWRKSGPGTLSFENNLSLTSDHNCFSIQHDGVYYVYHSLPAKTTANLNSPSNSSPLSIKTSPTDQTQKSSSREVRLGERLQVVIRDIYGSDLPITTSRLTGNGDSYLGGNFKLMEGERLCVTASLETEALIDFRDQTRCYFGLFLLDLL